MDEDAIHELTAAYALNALEERDEAAYEAHLGRCPACQRELASLQETATSLAYAVEGPAPAAALRHRILSQARSERANVAPLRRRWLLPAAASVAAVAASVAIGLGIWAASLSSSLQEERDARSDQERAFEVLARPDAERTALRGASGTLVVAPTGEAALVVSDLDPAPEEKTYEAWVIVGGEPRPAGLFEASTGPTVVNLTRPVPDGATVAVTIEDEKGADQPQGPFVLTAEAA